MAEHLVRTSRFRPPTVLRVDLHGVSAVGPGNERTLVRWEWIEDITVDRGVNVRAASGAVSFPPGAFGVEAEALATQLRAACSIDHRADVIEELSRSS